MTLHTPLDAHDYHPPKLVQLRAKGDKWYVQVTKPLGLQSGNDRQVRRSTGTTDRKDAERRLHRIADSIYAEFDRKLDELRPQAPVKITYATGPIDPFIQFRPRPIVPYDDPGKLISRIRRKYLQGRKWNRDKSRNGAKSHIDEFMAVIGNIQVDRIKKSHAYQFAKYLDEKGYGNKTIATRVSSVSAMLTWCEQMGRIEDSPFQNLKLSNYGVPTKPYKPFSVSELFKIFAQEVPEQERFALTILATTGMRLDEVALLRWDQFNSENDIRYFDLSESILKNDGSARKVPLHDRVILPTIGTGRIFDYPEGQDGKAQNNASRAMMPYIRSVVGDDERKVLHSFRGTFKDLLRDAGVSKELNDFITGHGAGDVAGEYGDGHSLGSRHSAINRLDVSFLGNSIFVN